jgi:hypothetical protein
MTAWGWTYLSNKKGLDEFKKVVLGDIVILLIGIAMWKGDLSVIAGLRGVGAVSQNVRASTG